MSWVGRLHFGHLKLIPENTTDWRARVIIYGLLLQAISMWRRWMKRPYVIMNAPKRDNNDMHSSNKQYHFDVCGRASRQVRRPSKHADVITVQLRSRVHLAVAMETNLRCPNATYLTGRKRMTALGPIIESLRRRKRTDGIIPRWRRPGIMVSIHA